jgi:hypothetical protein
MSHRLIESDSSESLLPIDIPRKLETSRDNGYEDSIPQNQNKSGEPRSIITVCSSIAAIMT